MEKTKAKFSTQIFILIIGLCIVNIPLGVAQANKTESVQHIADNLNKNSKTTRSGDIVIRSEEHDVEKDAEKTRIQENQRVLDHLYRKIYRSDSGVFNYDKKIN